MFRGIIKVYRNSANRTTGRFYLIPYCLPLLREKVKVQGLKISLITVTYNAEKSLHDCIESVRSQDYDNLEYIIIDGGSSDQTTKIVKAYGDSITHFLSESDRGIYDAMNKGIAMATGDIVGMLNADDKFADNNVLSLIAGTFLSTAAQIVYGDLDYVNDAGRTIRKWRTGQLAAQSFNHGWMPPHPTFYCKREIFDRLGAYSLDYGTAADYELMLRYLYVHQLMSCYLPQVMVKMKIGGASNRSLGNRLKALACDYKAMRFNRIKYPVMALFLKPLRKVIQFV